MTAVEWLLDQITQKDNLNNIRLGGTKIIYKLFEQAYQMERKQTIEFADRFAADCIGYSRVTSSANDISRAEEYYNELYETAE